jgi:AcrR family transcriptional regulator
METKRKKQKRAQITRDSILEAANRILQQDGVKKFTTNHIAKVAGVSIGSLYQYFRNKEKIIEELLSREIDKNLNHLEQIISQEVTQKMSGKDFIKLLINAYMQNWENKGVAAKVMLPFISKVLTVERLKKADDKLISYLKDKAQEFNLDVNPDNLDMALAICLNSVRASYLLSHTTYDHVNQDLLTDELSTMVHAYLTRR